MGSHNQQQFEENRGQIREVNSAMESAATMDCRKGVPREMMVVTSELNSFEMPKQSHRLLPVAKLESNK